MSLPAPPPAPVATSALIEKIQCLLRNDRRNRPAAAEVTLLFNEIRDADLHPAGKAILFSRLFVASKALQLYIDCDLLEVIGAVA